MAYAGAESGQSFVVVDEEVQAGYAGLVSGWAANPSWKSFPGYGQVGTKRKTIVFSPDGRHFAYAASEGQQHILVLDGRVKGRHSSILNRPVAFSPNSMHFAYGIEEGEKQRVVIEGQDPSAYDGLPPAELSFSPDSTMLAYPSWKGIGGRHALVVGSNEPLKAAL